MNTFNSHNVLNQLTTDKQLAEVFMQNMTLITKQTGIELAIDTNRPWIARMQPGSTKVHFNPAYTLQRLQAIADQRTEGRENFQFTINHLSEIVLHEINHMINHSELKLSTKTITVDRKKMSSKCSLYI